LKGFPSLEEVRKLPRVVPDRVRLAHLRAQMIDRCREREFFIDNLLVRIHFIIEMIRWTCLAP